MRCFSLGWIFVSFLYVVKGHWTLGPFTRLEHENPALITRTDTRFYCPLQKREVAWESKDVFNPSAVVKNGQVHLLYRAEDHDGNLAGTSRIGLALSDNGVSFPHSQRRTTPVLYPDNDEYKSLEWEGGIEDPRVVESPDGLYVMTYTSYNGVARLCIATSSDLVHWKKHGSAFKHAHDGVFSDVWSKSGSIVCELVGERLVATQINGVYWMYWGESNIYVATSKDLISWSPVTSESAPLYRGRPEQQAKQMNPSVVFGPRKGYFDSELVEPGPPALKTDHGIVFIYNSKNKWCMNSRDGKCRHGESDQTIPAGTYSAGQVLLDALDPTHVLARTEQSFFRPSMSYEITGQVANVVFLEGLVFHRGEMFLYYGTADSKIAVARSPIPSTLAKPANPTPPLVNNQIVERFNLIEGREKQEEVLIERKKNIDFDKNHTEEKEEIGENNNKNKNNISTERSIYQQSSFFMIVMMVIVVFAMIRHYRVYLRLMIRKHIISFFSHFVPSSSCLFTQRSDEEASHHRPNIDHEL